MEIEFRDDGLALIQSDRAAETGLPSVVIRSCCEKFAVIRAASDLRTLRNLRSLQYEKLEDRGSTKHSIRLNEEWRLIFELDEKQGVPALIVLAIDDSESVFGTTEHVDN
jgi:toxin HigB-1